MSNSDGPRSIDEILRNSLTREQYEAATDAARQILGLACAGSGKSRTLAYRITRLVAESENPADAAAGIVAFTFTEKAAESIKLRIAQALGHTGLSPVLLGRMFVGTIHSYCQNVLTQMDARYRQFEVLDENRLKLYLISRYYDLGLQALQQARGAKYFEVVRQVADAWTAMNDEMVSVEDVAAAAVDECDRELAEVMARLRDRLRVDHFIDFSLMIRDVVAALERRDPAVEAAVAQLRHLMVDEYQDVNFSQERLISQLQSRAQSLFAVGDDDQAIFAWRGADVGYILTFQRRYPGCSVRPLSENFRSTDAIVTAADGFAAAALGAQRFVKSPRAACNRSPRDFRVICFPDRDAEAEWVAARIEALLGTAYEETVAGGSRIRGLTPSDFVILMRSTRTKENDGKPRHSAFTSALAGRGIRFTLEAGGSVFDRPQVAVLREAFEMLRDGTPDRRDVSSFFRARVRPLYPCGDVGRLSAVFTKWGQLIHASRDNARRRVYPQMLLHELLDALGLSQSNFDDDVMHDIGVFSVMLQDVETVHVSVDSQGRFRGVLNFLQNVAEHGYDSSTLESIHRPDTVSVMTVHKAKGLEFPVVFVVDAEDGRFPKKGGDYDGWLPKKAIAAALKRGAFQGGAAEEARLFYTAVTRAERYLYVTAAELLPDGKQHRSLSQFALGLRHQEIETDPNGLPTGLREHPRVRRVDETVMPTSYSELRYFLRCPKDYKFRYVLGFSPWITEMFGYGKTVHAAVGKLHERFWAAAPTEDDAEAVARDMFHLKHVPQSRNPDTNPGPFERAKDSAVGIVRRYAAQYRDDFSQKRQLEQPFEVPIGQGVISGAIDLLLKVDPVGKVLEANVIDFKSMTGGPDPQDNPDLQWTELALQVQLYAMAARDVLGENARTGHVHLLRDGQRVSVPVDDAAVVAAVANVEWAVDRIVHEDFPARPHPEKCEKCDFRLLCTKQPQDFAGGGEPPPIHIPGQVKMVRGFSQFNPGTGEGNPSD